MNTRKYFAGLFALWLIVLAACAPAPTPTPVPTVARTTVVPVTVTDSANRSVTIATIPQRIVSLAPSTTEIAFALGLNTRVVAVDPFSDYPAETKNLPKVNSFPLNLEQIVALKPDLVLAAGLTSPDDVKKIADLKITLIVVGSPTATFDNVMADIALVGKATGTDAKAKQVNDAIKQKIDAVKAKIAGAKTQPRVYWELDMTDVTKPYTPGPGSFINDIITLAGGVNIAAKAKSPWAQISAEEIIAANPEVIILSDACSTSVMSPCATPDSVKTRKGWDALAAVNNNKILGIDDNLVSRPGPRVADGLEAAAKLVHPELFQ